VYQAWWTQDLSAKSIGSSYGDAVFWGSKMNSPFQIKLATGWGAYDSKKNGGQYAGLDVLTILVWEPSSYPKDKAPWIIPSEYRECDARSHKEQKKKGSYWLLTVDIDDGNCSIDAVKAVIIDLFGIDQLVRIYSTGSATVDCRKWRVLIPLEKPLEASRWQMWQLSLNLWLIEHGITPDRALERYGQLVYLPNVPPTHRGSDDEPLFYQNELIGNDLLTESSSQKWADWLALQTTINRQHESVAKAAASTKSLAHKNSDGTSVIEVFNQRYQIEDLLKEYGYQPHANGSDWRSPYQQGKTFATRNWGDYWTSLSSSDVSAGLGFQSESGCCGNAFSLYLHFQHRGDLKRAVKELME
jgi:hypothetical protein